MIERPLQILLVEDNDVHAMVIRRHLEKTGGTGVRLEHVTGLAAALERLDRGGVDALLLDLSLPDSQMNQTVPRVVHACGRVAVIVLTSLNDLEFAAKAVQQGAQDFLLKTDLDGELLLRSIRYAIERKKSQDKLQAYAAELKRSNERLKGFAHTLAHEVKSPLTVVGACLENLEERLATRIDDDLRDFVHDARAAIHGLSDLVNELLDFARSGMRDECFQEVNLEAVFYQAYVHLRLAIKQTGARIAHDPLPVVQGNETQLRQLLQNLISNAIKYRSEAPPEIHIAALHTGDFWRISVRDNGVGIPEEDLERVFDVFVRVHDTPDIPGTGIGLAFCKRIVENHGGRIWAESEPGRGTTFYFDLPLHKPQPADPVLAEVGAS